jgi:hypothetical protein
MSEISFYLKKSLRFPTGGDVSVLSSLSKLVQLNGQYILNTNFSWMKVKERSRFIGETSRHGKVLIQKIQLDILTFTEKKNTTIPANVHILIVQFGNASIQDG